MDLDLKVKAALLELLGQERIEEITIFEISDKCQVSRKFIFEKYDDKYQILQAIEDDIFSCLDNTNKDTYQIATHEFDQDDRILKILKLVHENRQVISLLLGEFGDPRFHERFINYLTQKGLKMIENSQEFSNLSQRQKELLIQYISSALVGLIAYWVKHQEMTVEELYGFLRELFLRGITSLTAK